MSYLRERGFGANCGPSCGCSRCGGRLAERYVRADDDEDADDEQPRPVRSAGIATGRARQRGAARLGAMAETVAAVSVIGGFAFDRADLGSAQHKQIIELARHLLARAVRAVRLVGHTDPVGTPAYNLDLGRRRAEAVRTALAAALERMRPGSARGLTVTAESVGEAQPLSRSPAPAERARDRRVEVFLPAAAPPACAYRLADAPAIELRAARDTLRQSAEVANRFVRSVGALSARGRFIPTVLDNKYWFAKLYEYITYYEIAEHARLAHPAFVLHFIPIFYNLYLMNLDSFLRGDTGRVAPLWLIHFRTAGRPPTGSATDWLNAVAASIRTGVEAHVRGDMATALEQAYRSFVRKYCLTDVPFDRFRGDFFDAMRPVFDRAKAALLLHLSQMGPFPVRPEVGQMLLATGEQAIGGGLSVDEIYRWREQAWQEARRRLGQ